MNHCLICGEESEEGFIVSEQEFFCSLDCMAELYEDLAELLSDFY